MTENRPLDQDGVAQLDALRQRFMDNLPERLNNIRSMVEALPVLGSNSSISGTANHLRLLDDELHKLVGSAGMFNCPDVTVRMKKIQQLVATWFDRDSEDEDSKRQQLLDILMAGASADPELDANAETEAEPSTKPPVRQFNSKAIHIIDDDFETAEKLRLHIEELGYLAQCFFSTSVYGDLFPTMETPALILMDMRFGTDSYAGAELTNLLRSHSNYVPPVVFISSYSDIESRLRALRSGAMRYIVKSELDGVLPKLLEEFVDRVGSKPYKVLLIDDDPLVSEANAYHLEQTNITTRSVANPMETLEVLQDFEPDVIVMDVIMPLANGFELASILREKPELDPVPIIFLSSEDNLESRLHAASLGGDDYLRKPCDEVFLTQTVLARARRARRLKQLLAAAGSQASH